MNDIIEIPFPVSNSQPAQVIANVKDERPSPQLNYKWLYFFPFKKKVEYLRCSQFDIRFSARGSAKMGNLCLEVMAMEFGDAKAY